MRSLTRDGVASNAMILCIAISCCIIHVECFSLAGLKLGKQERHGYIRANQICKGPNRGFARNARIGLPNLRCNRGGGQDGLSEADISDLLRRVSEAKARVAELPVLVLDAMLPKQRLILETSDNVFKSLTEACERGSFGMLGVDPYTRDMLRYGTEVELVAKQYVDNKVCVEIIGRRRFMLLGDPWQDDRGFFVSRLEFLENTDENPEDDTAQLIRTALDEADKEANAMACLELRALVHLWTSLVIEGKRERHPGQINLILSHLGPMPPEEQPRELAMWVAALINPLPALGVSLEIRPAVLAAPTAGAALFVALDGIKSSIGHLNGSRPLW